MPVPQRIIGLLYGSIVQREGTSQVKDIATARRVKVSADGRGVVSHAGMGLLRELADLTGLSTQVTAVLADTYRGPWTYAPGAVFADLAAAVADGADCIDGIGQLCGDREHVFGPKASTTTMWRLVDERIDAAHLPKIRDARAAARAAAWAAGAGPQTGQPLYIDIDATLVIDHSDNKAQAAPTWKKSFGHHPLLAFLDRPEIAGGEALAGLLRKGNAGSNTAADHITVLEQALASLPDRWRPDPDADSGPGVVVRCDSAGATHRFAAACRDNRVGFSFGFPVDARVWDAVDTLNLAESWYPAIDSSGDLRDGAWVAEATDLVNLATWPAGTRLILHKERPHPGHKRQRLDIQRSPLPQNSSFRDGRPSFSYSVRRAFGDNDGPAGSFYWGSRVTCTPYPPLNRRRKDSTPPVDA